MTGVHNILHHVGSPSLDFDRELATGLFRAGMRLVGASEVIVIPYLTVLSAIVRFGAILLSAAALLVAAALAARAAYLELRKFIVLFRIPHPPEEALLLGSALAMRQPNHHRSFRAWAKQLGGVYAVRIAFWHLVVVVDAELANRVHGNGEALSKALEPDLSDKLMSHDGHRTLFSSDTNSPYWRLIRKGAAPAFISKNIKNGFPDVVKILDQIVDNMLKLAPGEELDINNVTLRFAMDVTGLVGFAKDYGTTRSFKDTGTDELFFILQSTFRELYCRATNPARHLMLWLPEVRCAPLLFRAFRARMMELLQEVKARGEPGPEDMSIAAHLLRLREPATGRPLPDALLAGEFGVFFAAGIESAGNAISWTLYLLSQHPEVERKLAQELDAVGLLVTPERPNPRPMEYADLGRLTYLCWVCKEAMRVRPVASSGTTRRARHDMHLGGHLVPKGSLLLVPFDAVHHFPGNWPQDPDAFIPERWAVPGAELATSKGIPIPEAASDDLISSAAENKTDDDAAPTGPKRFLPFSTGPRQCIGQSLARIMHDVTVARLTVHFTLELAPRMGGPAGVDAAEINRLTLQPGGGMWMRVHPRGRHLSNGC